MDKRSDTQRGKRSDKQRGKRSDKQRGKRIRAHEQSGTDEQMRVRHGPLLCKPGLPGRPELRPEYGRPAEPNSAPDAG